MFWEGFYKQALRIGTKAVNPLNAAGRMVGNKPMTGVAMVSAHKPAALPTPVLASVQAMRSAKLPNQAPLASTPAKVKGGRGQTPVGAMKI